MHPDYAGTPVPERLRAAAADSTSPVYIANTDDAARMNLIRAFIRRVHQQVPVVRFQSLVINRSVSLYTGESELFYPHESESITPNTLLILSYHRYALAHKGVVGIRYNPFPWWQDLTQASVPTGQS